MGRAESHLRSFGTGRGTLVTLDKTVESNSKPTGVDGQLRFALDNMPGALVYTDDDLNIVFCNDRFKEMYQVPEELLQPGRSYLDFLRCLAENGFYGDGEVETQVAQRVQSLRDPSGKSFEDRAPDGRVYRILRRRAALGGTVTVMTDITEEKRASRPSPKRRRSSMSLWTTCRERSSSRTKIKNRVLQRSLQNNVSGA